MVLYPPHRSFIKKIAWAIQLLIPSKGVIALAKYLAVIGQKRACVSIVSLHRVSNDHEEEFENFRILANETTYGARGNTWNYFFFWPLMHSYTTGANILAEGGWMRINFTNANTNIHQRQPSKKSPVLIAVPKPVALFISETMLDHFGLNLISDPLRFETQGLLSENFLVKTKAGQKVVKWRKGGTQTRERLVKELELTEKVGSLGLQVSVPLKNSSNQYVHSDSNNCFACFNFIEGDYFK